jgi:hypothetical protein
MGDEDAHEKIILTSIIAKKDLARVLKICDGHAIKNPRMSFEEELHLILFEVGFYAVNNCMREIGHIPKL